VHKRLGRLSWTWIRQKFSPYGILVLGVPQATVALTILIGLPLWFFGQVHYARGLALTLVAEVASEVIKKVINRPRPVNRYTQGPSAPAGASFPSGDAAVSASFYPVLGWIILDWIGGLFGVAAFMLAVVWAFIVGRSRYTPKRCHYISDVIAGWLLGGTVASVIIIWVL
jgi:undecaprenyl-diphosphatase